MRAEVGSSDAVQDTVALLKEMEMLRTERDALQQRAASLAADLDSLAQGRDEFLATASHDLKSPLTSILGGTQYIERLLVALSPDGSNATSWARIIQDQARTMTLLINDLLETSRLQTGAFDLRLAPCDMVACVNTVTRHLVPDLQARVQLTGAPPTARGSWDRQRIEQVLSNLLDNALKYSPNGENISVGVESRAGEVEVTVIDCGVGISAAELQRIFERFYRSAHASNGDALGTGLGLYICERIISAHGGELWAESAGLGRGSTFRFTLPMRSPTATSSGRPKGQTR